MHHYRKVLSVFIVTLSMFTLGGCSASSQESQTETVQVERVERVDRDGYSATYDNWYAIGDYSFKIPSYYNVEKEGRGVKMDAYEMDRRSAIVRLAPTDLKLTKLELESSLNEVFASFGEDLDGAEVTEIKQISSEMFTIYRGSMEWEESERCWDINIYLIYSSSKEELLALLSLEDQENVFTYTPDIERMLRNARKDQSLSLGSNEVTPFFKKTLDEYEAFTDEYVATMLSIGENPTSDEALTQLLLTEKMLDIIEKLSSEEMSEMSLGDATYFLEVYRRIMNKLDLIN